MILTPAELETLTRKKRPGWQRRVLDAMHIPSKPRPDGTLVVLWEDVRAAQNAKPQPREPQVRVA